MLVHFWCLGASQWDCILMRCEDLCIRMVQQAGQDGLCQSEGSHMSSL